MAPPPTTSSSSSISRPSRAQTTLPPATTASAKAARSAFFCQLCQKGYSRINEFENHEGSYDHQHKKRLKEMKEMQRVVQNTFSSGQKDSSETKEGGLVSIKLGSVKDGSTTGPAGGGFKKGGFKNAFAPVGGNTLTGAAATVAGKSVTTHQAENTGGKQTAVITEIKPPQELEQQEDSDDDSFVEPEDYYDPAKPTDCMPGCASVHT